MQQPRRRHEDGRITEAVYVVKEKLSIDIALRRREREPAHGGVFVLLHTLAGEIELAEGILGVLIVLLRGGRHPPDGGGRVLGDILAGEIQPAEPVHGKVAALVGGELQKPERLGDVFLDAVSLGIELSQRVLGEGVPAVGGAAQISDSLPHTDGRGAFVGEDVLRKLIGRKGVSQLCGFLEVFQRGGDILFRANAV
jgi:hypothetical protein